MFLSIIKVRSNNDAWKYWNLRHLYFCAPILMKFNLPKILLFLFTWVQLWAPFNVLILNNDFLVPNASLRPVVFCVYIRKVNCEHGNLCLQAIWCTWSWVFTNFHLINSVYLYHDLFFYPKIAVKFYMNKDFIFLSSIRTQRLLKNQLTSLFMTI